QTKWRRSTAAEGNDPNEERIFKIPQCAPLTSEAIERFGRGIPEPRAKSTGTLSPTTAQATGAHAPRTCARNGSHPPAPSEAPGWRTWRAAPTHLTSSRPSLELCPSRRLVTLREPGRPVRPSYRSDRERPAPQMPPRHRYPEGV